jgi:hypothetical protein
MTTAVPALGFMGNCLSTLLAQKLIRIGRDISPSGYPLLEQGAM